MVKIMPESAIRVRISQEKSHKTVILLTQDSLAPMKLQNASLRHMKVTMTQLKSAPCPNSSLEVSAV